MPANLSPDYLGAEKRFKAARTPTEKLEALEEMLSTLPKHKGTEKMQADLRRRLSKLRAEGQKKGGAAHALPLHYVEKEGAGQVALVGAPNAGKSRLVCRLTHARPAVADYPFSTRLPTPGMMPFEDIQVQLVDLPPVSAEFMESWVPTLVRQADAAALVLDLAAGGLLDELERTRALLEANRVRQRTLVVGNKLDLSGADENFSALGELFPGLAMVAVSAETGAGLEGLKRALFDLLGLVRVYTKAPGKKPDRTAPYVLKRGATASNAAEHVHKDFAAQLKFARIWAHGKYEGQMVQREYVLDDGDIIEFHI